MIARRHSPLARVGTGILLCAALAVGLVALFLDALGRAAG